MDKTFDQQMMLLALELGEKSRLSAPPNPWVGCVLAQREHIVGRGSTQRAGEPHAEIIALGEAGSKSHGATAYISLEPCCHFGRTPPCTDALIKAGIARVCIAIEDPDKRVNGKGIKKLQEAGIEVVLGICEKEASVSLEPYLYQRKEKRPFLIAKSACSIDGRIAAADGSSQWISSEKARMNANLLRASSQAILIGSKTAIRDLPRLTVRDFDCKPLRVVLDSRGSLEAKGALFDTELAPTLLMTTSDAPISRIQEWQSKGAEVAVLEKNVHGTGIHLTQALKLLGERGILQVLCEGGGELLGALFQEALVNRFILYIGSRILGDNGKPLLSNFGVSTLDAAPKLTLLHAQEMEGTVRLDYSI